MSYSSWFQTHGAKHRAILATLTHLTPQEIVAYFRFEHMQTAHPDFCPLYAQNKKCHAMENLNCYLCACPNFRFDDAGFETIGTKELMSYCSVNSPDGARFEGKSKIHQNCSGCTIPHHEAFILQHFSRDWFEMMAEVKSLSAILPTKTTKE